MMKLLFTIAVLLTLNQSVPVYAAEEQPAEDAEIDVITEASSEELLQEIRDILNDISGELNILSGCYNQLEDQNNNLTSVIDVIRMSNSLLLILIGMEFMRLVRGWTKGGRHKDGYTG